MEWSWNWNTVSTNITVLLVDRVIYTYVTGKGHNLFLLVRQQNRSIRFIQRWSFHETSNDTSHTSYLSLGHTTNATCIFSRVLLYPLDAPARGLGCRGWLAPSAARGSSINSHQDENGARGQTRGWRSLVDLVGPEITAISWIESYGYGRDAPSRGRVKIGFQLCGIRVGDTYILHLCDWERPQFISTSQTTESKHPFYSALILLRNL